MADASSFHGRIQPDSNDFLYVILNPVAGMIQPDRTSQQILDWCDQHGLRCEIYLTSEGENLAPVVASAVQRGCNLVAACGGDGTVSAVAAGMVNCPVPLLILPLGTGNMLAREFGIPFSLQRSLGVILSETECLHIDVMQMNDRFGVLNVGVGFSSMLIKNTDRSEKRRLGFLAYLKSGLRALFGLQPHNFRLVVDGKKISIKASEIYIANSGLLGVQIPFEDVHISPNDGRVDLFIIKARTLRDYLEILYYIIRRKPRRAREMLYFQGSEMIRIESEHPLPVQSDGEVIGETPLTIRILPNAVKVLLPAHQDEGQFTRLRRAIGL